VSDFADDSMTDLETVLAWHAALNAGDAERVVALSWEDVEVGGPRGAGRGIDLLRDWVGRSRIQLSPLRTFFADGPTIVVEQAAQWATTGGGVTEPEEVASVFRVRDGRISAVIRYPDVLSALEAAGLDPSLPIAPAR
jgi:ketosteroid isomerase-like protein